MTLTEFLLARIAEDEDRFRDAVEAEVQRCRADGMPDLTAEEVRAYWLRPKGEGVDEVERAGTEWPRYLAECEAKRRIVEMLAANDEDRHLPGFHYKAQTIERVLRTLALPYADHPDFREKWKP